MNSNPKEPTKEDGIWVIWGDLERKFLKSDIEKMEK